MDPQVALGRLRKRRRHNRALREDDVESADAVIVQSAMRQTDDGPVEEVTRVPTWTNRPAPTAEPEAPPFVWNDTELPEIPEMQEDNSTSQRAGTSRVGNKLRVRWTDQ